MKTVSAAGRLGGLSGIQARGVWGVFLTVFAVWVALRGIPAPAQEAGKGGGGEGEGGARAAEEVRPPEAEDVTGILIPEMEGVVTLAVQGLRARAEADPDFFFVPPERHRRVVGHKEVSVRYSRKTFEQPIYKYEYETYKVVVNRKGNSEQAAGKLETVTRRRLVSKKKVGTKEVTRTVRDKEGDIVKTERRPIYGPGGADEHFPGFFGQNAMALYLCVKAGVPLDDDLMDATSHNVAYLAMGYGLPDRTWDLAWLTAAMVNMPKDDPVFREASERLVNKLLLGQIGEGDGEGLWGPVSVNPTVLRALVETEREFYEDEMRPWEQKLKENPDRDYYKEKLEEAKEIFKEYRDQYPWVTQLGFKFSKVKARRTGVSPHGEYVYSLQTGTGMDDGRGARIQGLPHYIYEEQLADLESTSVALFALREAADHGYLPAKTWVPVSPEGEPLVPARGTKDIIRSAFNAVAARVNDNGTAGEGNLWVKIADFEGMAGVDRPYAEDRIDGLDSGVDFTTTARACTALMDAAAMLGDAKGLNLEALNASRRTLSAMIEGFLKDDLRGMKVGGHTTPYEFVFLVSRAVDCPVPLSPEQRNLWAWVSEYLLENRELQMPRKESEGKDKKGDEEEQAEGTEDEVAEPQGIVWLEGRERTLVSSVREFVPEDLRQKMLEQGEDELEEKIKKKYEHRKRYWRAHLARLLDNKVVATCYAGNCLLSGMRPPIAAVWAWNGRSPRTGTIEPVVKRLAKENGTDLAHLVVNAAFPPNAATGVPLLLISGSGEFEVAEEGSLERLLAYLEAGGRLVVEAPANEQGIGFLKAAQQVVADGLPEAKVLRLPPMADGLPKVVAIRDADGLRAAFTTIATSADDERENVFSPGDAMRFVYLLLQKSLPDDYFDPQYAIHWDRIVEYEERMRLEREREGESHAADFEGAEEDGEGD